MQTPTEKHFIGIAREINEHRILNEPKVAAILDMLSRQIAYRFHEFGPHFDEDLFLTACGLSSPHFCSRLFRPTALLDAEFPAPHDEQEAYDMDHQE